MPYTRQQRLLQAAKRKKEPETHAGPLRLYAALTDFTLCWLGWAHRLYTAQGIWIVAVVHLGCRVDVFVHSWGGNSIDSSEHQRAHWQLSLCFYPHSPTGTLRITHFPSAEIQKKSKKIKVCQQDRYIRFHSVFSFIFHMQPLKSARWQLQVVFFSHPKDTSPTHSIASWKFSPPPSRNQ